MINENSSPGKTNRICIVFDSPTQDSYYNISETPLFLIGRLLAQNNYAVSVLIVVQSRYETAEFDFISHVKEIFQIQVTFTSIPSFEMCEQIYLRKSKAVYEFFMTSGDSYDVVLFSESQGIPYLCLKCKNSIPSLEHSILGILLQEPIQWRKETNREPIDYLNAFYSDFERSSVCLADFVISPSTYLINWVKQKGWILPKDVFVIPYLYLMDELWSDLENNMYPMNFCSDIIFYGTFTLKDGLIYFLESLQLIPKNYTNTKQLTILTPDSYNDALPIYKQINGLKEKFKSVYILDNHKKPDIHNYLQKRGALWVFPSLSNISPYVIYASLKEQLPFICSSYGGQCELIDENDHQNCLFDPRPQAIAKKIIEIIQSNQCVTPSPSDILKNAKNNCINVFDKLSIKARNKIILPLILENSLVSIIIPTYNRPDKLPEAVESAMKQSYQNTELIIVDDGSTNPDVTTVISSLKGQYGKIRSFHQENKYLGAARNTGVKMAKGDYLVFLDDDDLLFPDYISTCLDIISKEKVDCVLPATMSIFQDNKTTHWISAGGGVTGVFMPTSIIENTYGSSSMLIKRDLCLQHPYPEFFRAGWEDWSLLIELHLSGVPLAIYPRPLFCYRRTSDSMLQTTSQFYNFSVLAYALEKANHSDYALLGQLCKFCLTHETNIEKTLLNYELNRILNDIKSNNSKIFKSVIHLCRFMIRLHNKLIKYFVTKRCFRKKW